VCSTGITDKYAPSQINERQSSHDTCTRVAAAESGSESSDDLGGGGALQ
jgi:hypothetical protein